MLLLAVAAAAPTVCNAQAGRLSVVRADAYFSTARRKIESSYTDRACIAHGTAEPAMAIQYYTT